jgi:hypothetical protein
MAVPKLPLPDSDPITVNRLRHKRAEIAGRIAMMEQTAEQLRADLVHIDAVLRLLDPHNEPETIGALRIVPRRTEWFPRGEITRRIYEALRDAPDIRAQDLAEAAIADKGLSLADRRLRREFVYLFLNTANFMARKGKLVKLGKGPGTRFRLPASEPDLL